jgi:hypothetical protein
MTRSIKSKGSRTQQVPKGQKHPYTRWQGTRLWKVIDEAVCDLVQNRDLAEDEYHEYIVGYICRIIERRKKAVIAQLQTRPSSTISPDHVWRLYEGKKVRLTVRLLREEKPEGKPSILLEGDRTSLEWLADMILASAAFEQDCGSFVAPDGPGNIFFNKKKSEFGIYIHRMPCLERVLCNSPASEFPTGTRKASRTPTHIRR